MDLIKYRNKAGVRTQRKTTLLWNNCRKERQEDYATSAVYAAALYLWNNISNTISMLINVIQVSFNNTIAGNCFNLKLHLTTFLYTSMHTCIRQFVINENNSERLHDYLSSTYQARKEWSLWIKVLHWGVEVWPLDTCTARTNRTLSCWYSRH